MTRPVPDPWQQQPWVMVTQSAELSHLLAGNVQYTVRCTAFIVIDRSSALENSISRSIHQEPRMRDAAGLQGPPVAQAVLAEGSDGIFSRMRPS